MWGYEQRGVKYDTLYGYEPTRAEWEAQQAERKKLGWLFQESEFRKPWHCGWQRTHNGGSDMTGEWRWSGSWTCKKIIRPSYDQNTAVYLVVSIGGKHKRGGYRPVYWTARVEMAGMYGSYWLRMKKPKSCNSVADACRKAEKLPWIDNEVKALLKRAYAVTNAEALYRKDGDDYVPYMTRFRLGGTPSDWPSGEYFSTHWDKPMQGPKLDQWTLDGRHYNVSGYGYGSGPYHEPGTPYSKDMIAVHYAMVEATGCWLPKPVDPPAPTQGA